MTWVTIPQAEEQLVDLIARAEAGEEILIVRNGEPVVALRALPRTEPAVAKRPVFGSMRGKFATPPNSFFFDPLPDDELKAWEGLGDDPMDDALRDTGINKDKP